MATCPFLPEEHSFILVFFHKNRGLSHNDQFHALLYLYCKGRDYFPIQQIFPYICTMKINPLTYAELSRPMYRLFWRSRRTLYGVLSLFSVSLSVPQRLHHFMKPDLDTRSSAHPHILFHLVIPTMRLMTSPVVRRILSSIRSHNMGVITSVHDWRMSI